jgi:Rieske Fe-S protein
MNQRMLRWEGALLLAAMGASLASSAWADAVPVHRYRSAPSRPASHSHSQSSKIMELGLAAQVQTGDGQLNVHAGPGTGFYTYDSVDDGFVFNLVCQHRGSTVTGTYGASALWDQTSRGGWLADAFVHTGSNAQIAPTCEYVGDPPRANPRQVDDAVSWEYARLGSSADEGYCLRFQAQAFGWSYAGFATAQDQFQWLRDNGQISHHGPPPRGALVWYSTGDGDGHVTVSVGAGRVIGTSVRGVVGVADYDYLGSFEGWSAPEFVYGG